MKTARAFMTGIIDFAGLFPPASLSMDDAVREFARYTDGDDRDLLGRFIVPAARLPEFATVARPLVGGQRAPWRVSAIVAPGKESDTEAIEHFNRTERNIVVDAIEMAVKNQSDVEWASRFSANDFAVFLEPTDLENPSPLLTAIAASGAKAKLRTGGVVASAIPSATAVMRFMNCCADLSLPFKATAGLHHALRGDYALTYEANAPRGTMFGYLNIFLVAAFRSAGLPESALFDLLEEKDSSSITFDEAGAWWRGNLADVSHLSAARKMLAVSFGSCSFTEPVDEARSMNLI